MNACLAHMNAMSANWEMMKNLHALVAGKTWEICIAMEFSLLMAYVNALTLFTKGAAIVPKWNPSGRLLLEESISTKTTKNAHSVEHVTPINSAALIIV